MRLAAPIVKSTAPVDARLRYLENYASSALVAPSPIRSTRKTISIGDDGKFNIIINHNRSPMPNMIPGYQQMAYKQHVKIRLLTQT